jgi:hypothetical protein
MGAAGAGDEKQERCEHGQSTAHARAFPRALASCQGASALVIRGVPMAVGLRMQRVAKLDGKD